MGQLSSISADPTIREYAQGAAQQAIMPVAGFLAPTVSVSASVGRYKAWDDKTRFHLPETERAVGGRASQVQLTAADATYNCTPRALDFPVDKLEENESGTLGYSLFREGANVIAQLGALDHEKRVIDLAVAATTSGAVDNDFTSSSVDPVSVLDTQILNVIKAAKFGSMMGVRVLFGATAWLRTKNNANVVSRYSGVARKKSAGADTPHAPTLDDFGELLIAKPEAQIALSVVDTAPEGAAESASFILDDKILVFAATPNPTRFDPSFMKTFRLDGHWMVPGAYETEDGRSEVAKFDWSCDPKVTNTSAAVQVIANNS